jgi:hypothetical protein
MDRMATLFVAARTEVVRLYIYSSTANTLTRVYWLRLQYALIGAVIGAILFSGVIAFAYFGATTQSTRTLYDLRIENDVLRQHVDLAASRVAAIEKQVQHLHNRNFALRASIAQSDYAEQRLFTLINPVTAPDSLLLSTVTLSSGR